MCPRFEGVGPVYRDARASIVLQNLLRHNYFDSSIDLTVSFSVFITKLLFDLVFC